MSSDQSETQSVMTQPSPTTMGTSSSVTGAVIGAIVAVLFLLIVVALAIYLWYYFKRRKQSHNFQEPSASSDNTPSFRVLSAWEEAISSQQKQKDASDYTSAQMGYSTPDLIVGTHDNNVIHNNQYERLRGDTITSETSNLPTIDEVSERPIPAEFDNPGFEIGLDEILDTSLFTGRIELHEETKTDDDSDDERNLSQSPTDLEKDVPIIDGDPKKETTIEKHNEEENHVSTKEGGLSDDLNVEIDDPSQRTEEVSDRNSENIENGLDNAGFEMDTDMDGNDTSSESPTASSDIDNST